MSYRTTNARSFQRPTGLGSVATTVSAATAIVTDPCLPEVSRLVLRLRELEAGPTKPGVPTTTTPGIGLCKVVKPLRAVVYVRERPWVGVLGVVGVVGGLIGLGYALGRGR